MKKESVPNNSFYNSNFKNKKILIIVPHQDDELFLCGTILDSLRKVTSNIYVAFVTNGDYGNDFNQRYIECLSAMKIFQISSKNVICLGYGDQYETKYGHIYHAPMEEIVMSKRGKKQTYGKDYIYSKYKIHHDYTLTNLYNDLEMMIRELWPDVIFCNDMDWHPDHRAVSLIFDRIIGRILNSNYEYHPDIYKGFVYGFGWDGVDDYNILNLRSTVKPKRSRCNDKRFELNNPYYKWEERVRFPVSDELLSKRKNKLWKAIGKYRFSQNAKRFYNSMMNSDAVFWKRHTKNLAIQAHINVSSGNSDNLQDFVIMDSSDILKSVDMPCDRGIWYPDMSDEEIFIKYYFESPVNPNKIILYRDVKSYGLTSIYGVLKYKGKGNVEYAFEIGKYDIKYEIDMFDAKDISFIELNFQKSYQAFGFSEIEILENLKLPVYVKGMYTGNYIYHYYCEKSCEKMIIEYCCYPNDDIKIEIIEDDKSGSYIIGNTIIMTDCFKKIMLKLTSSFNNEVYDVITIERRNKNV